MLYCTATPPRAAFAYGCRLVTGTAHAVLYGCARALILPAGCAACITPACGSPVTPHAPQVHTTVCVHGSTLRLRYFAVHVAYWFARTRTRHARVRTARLRALLLHARTRYLVMPVHAIRAFYGSRGLPFAVVRLRGSATTTAHHRAHTRFTGCVTLPRATTRLPRDTTFPLHATYRTLPRFTVRRGYRLRVAFIPLRGCGCVTHCPCRTPLRSGLGLRSILPGFLLVPTLRSHLHCARITATTVTYRIGYCLYRSSFYTFYTVLYSLRIRHLLLRLPLPVLVAILHTPRCLWFPVAVHTWFVPGCLYGLRTRWVLVYGYGSWFPTFAFCCWFRAARLTAHVCLHVYTFTLRLPRTARLDTLPVWITRHVPRYAFYLSALAVVGWLHLPAVRWVATHITCCTRLFTLPFATAFTPPPLRFHCRYGYIVRGLVRRTHIYAHARSRHHTRSVTFSWLRLPHVLRLLRLPLPTRFLLPLFIHRTTHTLPTFTHLRLPRTYFAPGWFPAHRSAVHRSLLPPGSVV